MLWSGNMCKNLENNQGIREISRKFRVCMYYLTALYVAGDNMKSLNFGGLRDILGNTHSLLQIMELDVRVKI